MEYIEFSNIKQYKDKEYSYINAYIIDDAIFFIEPNFYTQLVYFKEYYKDMYSNYDKQIYNYLKKQGLSSSELKYARSSSLLGLEGYYIPIYKSK